MRVGHPNSPVLQAGVRALASLQSESSANHGLEIGYWVRSDCSGQGICTLAVKMAVLAGFQVMGLKRIQVGCDGANVGNRRVIEKVGFSFEGIQRNMGEVDPPPEAVERGWRGSGDTTS